MTNLLPRFLRRYGEHATFVAKCMVNTYGHLAVAIATEIYDGEGELQSHEQQFLTDIRSADARRSESLANAGRMFGFGSTAYLATERLASNRRNDDYQRALDMYELALDAADEMDEIEGTLALIAEAAE